MYALIQKSQIVGYTEESQVEGFDCIVVPEGLQSPKYEDGQIVEGYSPSRKEIGDTIVEKAFDNNPHAQIADLTTALVGISYLLVQSHGKENVRSALGPLIQTIENVSNVRENMGLHRFDISFLE